VISRQRTLNSKASVTIQAMSRVCPCNHIPRRSSEHMARPTVSQLIHISGYHILHPSCTRLTLTSANRSGYCPYPAGALCYRDARMRYQVTWTSPIVAHEGESENIGVYGVEGSKPGAAAVGTYLSHEVIGLNYKGYGALLGEATFSCTRVTNSSPHDYKNSRSHTFIKIALLPLGHHDRRR